MAPEKHPGTPEDSGTPPTTPKSPTESWHADHGEPVELHSRETEHQSSSTADASLSLDLPITIGRYQLQEVLGRGGMGAVLLGRDTVFDRLLAFKVLLDRYLDHPQAIRRLDAEARIMSRLQHPGIAPVHDQGTLPDGRPFFCMKLIEGKTLETILGQRINVSESLPLFLTIFAQTCQTVAYAHSQGIIHRDLKPANVMVGAFGEVQVMDWGLARLLCEPGMDQTAISTASSELPGNSEATEMGSILGTPAYLSPEQARGAIDEVDQRSDVFGLGAILCEILTGRPPYVETGSQSTRKQAAQGDLTAAFERLDSSTADPELIQIAKRALASKPEDRFPDALEVAHRITHHQDVVQARLHQAEIERGQMEVQAREERKRRKLGWALSAVVVLLLTLSGGTYLYVQNERAIKRQRQVEEHEKQKREEFTRRQFVGAAVDKALSLIGDARWDRARLVLTQTRKHLGKNLEPGLAEALTQTETDLARAEEINSHLFRHSLSIPKAGERSTASETYRDLFVRAKLALPGDKPEVIAERIRKSRIRSIWIAALDDWSVAAPPQEEWQVLEIARLADQHQLRKEFRDPGLVGDYQRLVARMQEVEITQLTPTLWAGLCLRLQSFERRRPALRKDGSAALAMMQRAHQLAPDDFWLNYLLGNLNYTDNPTDAIGYYRAALALRPRSFPVLLNLGGILGVVNQHEEALHLYLNALQIHPNRAAIYHNLGGTYLSLRRWEDAKRAFEKSVDINPKFAASWAQLGYVWWQRKEYDKAKAACEKAIELDRDTYIGRLHLCSVYGAQGKTDKLIEVGRELVKLYPDKSRSLRILARALRFTKQYPEALKVYRTLVQKDPGSPDGWIGLGAIYFQRGEHAEGIRWMRQATLSVPRNPIIHGSLGHHLLEAGRFEESLVSLKTCLQLLPKGPESGTYQLTVRHVRRCEQYLRLEQRLRAILEKRSEPKDAEERLNLGRLCLQYRSRYAQAARLYAEAFQLQPELQKSPKTQYRLQAARAAVLAGTDRDVEALSTEEQARMRKQALDWLQADLKILREQSKDPKEHRNVQSILENWLRAPELAVVREKSSLEKLPEGERKSWESLWMQYLQLLEQVRKSDTEPKPNQE